MRTRGSRVSTLGHLLGNFEEDENYGVCIRTRLVPLKQIVSSPAPVGVSKEWRCQSEVNILIMASPPPPSTPLFVAVSACQVHLPYPACFEEVGSIGYWLSL